MELGVTIFLLLVGLSLFFGVILYFTSDRFAGTYTPRDSEPMWTSTTVTWYDDGSSDSSGSGSDSGSGGGE